MDEAEKREKVIRGFECCLRNDHKKCPYYSADIMDTTCYTRLHTDALDLLTERHVMRYKIITNGNCIVCGKPLVGDALFLCEECCKKNRRTNDAE